MAEDKPAQSLRFKTKADLEAALERFNSTRESTVLSRRKKRPSLTYGKYFCDPCNDDGDCVDAVVFCKTCKKYRCYECKQADEKLYRGKNRHTFEQLQSEASQKIQEQNITRIEQRDQQSHDEASELGNVNDCNFNITSKSTESLDFDRDISEMQQIEGNVNDCNFNITSKSTESLDFDRDISERQQIESPQSTESKSSQRDCIDGKRIQKADTVYSSDFEEDSRSNEQRDKQSKDGTLKAGNINNTNVNTKSESAESTDIFGRQETESPQFAETKLTEEDYIDAVAMHEAVSDTSSDAEEEFTGISPKPSLKSDIIKDQQIQVLKIETERECDITDIACLSNGSLVLTDTKNECLKVIASNNDISILELDSWPWNLAVSCLADNHVYITLPDVRKVVLVKIAEDCIKMNPNHICTSGDCWGIACISDGLIVTIWNEHCKSGYIQILDFRGVVKSTFETDEKLCSHLNGSCYLTVSKAETRLYVADPESQTIMAIDIRDDKLKIHSLFRHKDFGILCGIAVDKHGDVYVIDLQNKCLHKLSKECNGNYSNKVVLSQSDGLVLPRCVCFSSYNMSLYTGGCADHVQAFKFTRHENMPI